MTSSLQQLQPSLPDMIQASQRLSAADRLLLAKALLDSLVAVRSGEPMYGEQLDEPNVVEDEALMRERKAFIALHPTLLAQYPGEYVAIHSGALIDHDKDGLALSLRVHQRFPDEFVWIAPLKAQALEEWVVRSPRFEAITQ
jgi:hypothetical protein